jgi:hypothetical protein
MSLQEHIRNIIFFFVKTHYTNYLKENNLKYIDNSKIEEIIKEVYVDKKKELQQFIKNCLKDMMKDNYPGALVENIIFEIFQDQDLAINRVTIEIQKYQDYILNNQDGEEYEITVPIDPDYGIGLKIDFFENDVVVKNYKRNGSNNLLPAEKSGKISIGDSLIKINKIDLEILSTEEKINIVQTAMKNDFISLQFRTFINNKIIEKELN